MKQLGEVVEVWAAADIVVRSRRLRLSADPFDALAALRGQLDGGGLELTLHPGSVARAQRRDSWQSGWQLRTALEGLSPSQRGTWRTLLVDATARPDRQRADGEPRRWQQYQGARCGDQRTMAEAISALLGGGVTTVLAPRRYPVTGRWARLDATAVLLDDLVDAARREPPDPPDRTGAAR